jgi:large subunit ribosomal protein L30
MSEQSKKTIRITLIKSLIGTRKNHRLIIKGLGLKKLHSTSDLEDTQSIRGMIKKVNYLLKCE